MEKKVIQNQGNNECVLHQNTARMRGSLTPIQSKSMLAIFKRANDEVALNPDIKDFVIPTSVFLEDIQLKDNSSNSIILDNLQKHLRVLMTKTFEWGTPEQREMCVFMQKVTLNKDTVTFKFSDYIREHIKPLSKALIIKDFELIQSFRSEYARQLYKHIMMWESKGTMELSIKDFKDFLGVPNTSSYDRLDVLKRKVLNVAIAEINEKRPELQLMVTNKKDGKKVIRFGFGWFFVKQTKDGLFSNEDLKTEFIDYIGKYLNDSKTAKVLAITPFDKPQKYRLDTPIGEYIFPNIEMLRKEIELYNK
jgi:plasmid replication initiation protein